MSPTSNYVLAQTCLLSIFWFFWLPIGGIVFAIMRSWLSPLFIRDDIVVIREKGFRLEGAIDLNPDRYEYPVTHSLNADTSLEIRNTTAHTVRVCPQNKDELVTPVFSLQQPDAKAPSPEAPASEITLAAGQSGRVTFEFGGDYDLTAHSLDEVALPYNRLIVHVSATPMAVITEQGFLITKTIADLRSADLNPDRYEYPVTHSLKADSWLKVKNATAHPVRVCPQNKDELVTPAFSLQRPDAKAPSPEAPASEITLAAGQSGWVTFELGGDYDLTAHSLDEVASPYNRLIVHVSATTPKVVITEQGFLITKTIADLRSASYTQSASYSIKTDVKARFKNLTDQPVRLCLGNNGVCNPRAAGPKKLRSGLTLAPGQSASVTFSRVGDYDITAYAPDHPPFSYRQLVVHVEDSD